MSTIRIHELTPPHQSAIKRVKVGGRWITLYRMSNLANSWCSDRQLAREIERKRQATMRALRAGIQGRGFSMTAAADEDF